MSGPIKHADAIVGNFELHDNGSIFWGPEMPRNHHMSWLDDAGQRVYAPHLELLCSPEELQQCQELARAYDAKEIK